MFGFGFGGHRRFLQTHCACTDGAPPATHVRACPQGAARAEPPPGHGRPRHAGRAALPHAAGRLPGECRRQPVCQPPLCSVQPQHPHVRRRCCWRCCVARHCSSRRAPRRYTSAAPAVPCRTMRTSASTWQIPSRSWTAERCLRRGPCGACSPRFSTRRGAAGGGGGGGAGGEARSGAGGPPHLQPCVPGPGHARLPGRPASRACAHRTRAPSMPRSCRPPAPSAADRHPHATAEAQLPGLQKPDDAHHVPRSRPGGRRQRRLCWHGRHLARPGGARPTSELLGALARTRTPPARSPPSCQPTRAARPARVPRVPPLQLEIGVSRAQAEALLPHYSAYRARQAELGAEWATAMGHVLALQVRWALPGLGSSTAGGDLLATGLGSSAAGGDLVTCWPLQPTPRPWSPASPLCLPGGAGAAGARAAAGRCRRPPVRA